MPVIMYSVIKFDPNYYIVFVFIITLISLLTSTYFLKIIKLPDQTDYVKFEEENVWSTVVLFYIISNTLEEKQYE